MDTDSVRTDSRKYATMKRGTPDHPKMLDLAEAVHDYLAGVGVDLPFEIVHTLACGMFERLCHYTARYAPGGDIGKHSNMRIALAVGWKFDVQFIIDVLVKVRILDVIDGESRLYVHDWHDHSDDAADKWLHDKGLCYANGMPTRRGKGARESKSRPSRDPVATQSRQSEPEPRPKPSSEPESSSQPRPKPKPVTVSESSSSGDLFDEDVAELWALDIAKALPPRNEHDARRWCQIAIAAQTTFSENWFRVAIDTIQTKTSTEGPYAHFQGILNLQAKQKNIPNLKAFLNSIAVPDGLLDSITNRKEIARGK